MRAMDLKRLEIVGRKGKYGFPLFGTQRVVWAALAPQARLFMDLRHVVGNTKLAIILSRFGYEAGMTSAMNIADMYDFDSPEEWLKAGSVLRKFAGVALEEMQALLFEPEKKRLRFSGTWRESYEALAWQRMREDVSEAPVCHMLCGSASGFASVVAGTEVLVRETACRAQGHPCCTFEARTLEEWGIDPVELRASLKLDNLEADIARLQEALEKSREELQRQENEILQLRRHSRPVDADHGIIFRSESMARILELAEKVAQTSSTVLIQGESGTGKELFSRYIHINSRRKDKPFIGINCAALPPNLLESELFGHVKGAFTGADRDKTGLFVEAGDGTIFLDEVGDIPLALQVKLLRALQEKEVRPVGGLKNISIKARIIAATNKDLKKSVADGAFREDLYYRLAVFPIFMVPLRHRRQDILLLARHFLSRLNPDHPGFSPEAIRRMEAYPWPGNVRELENWVEYATVLSGEERIVPAHLPSVTQLEPGIETDHDPLQGLAADYPDLKELERRYTERVLAHTNGNRSDAARILGTSITTLWRRLKADSGR